MESDALQILTQARGALGDLEMFVWICAQALELRGDPTVMPALSKMSEYFGISFREPTQPEEKELFAKFAGREHSDGYPALYELATIRLWTLLESAVDDLAIAMIRDFAETRALPAIMKLTGPLVEYASATESDQAEQLLNLLKNDKSASLKEGCGRFESLLNAINLGGPVTPKASKKLLELSEVRHVLVHRRGRVDRKLLSKCPWLPQKIGERFKPTREHFNDYGACVHWYLFELERRAQVELQGDADPIILALHDGMRRFIEQYVQTGGGDD